MRAPVEIDGIARPITVKTKKLWIKKSVGTRKYQFKMRAVLPPLEAEELTPYINYSFFDFFGDSFQGFALDTPLTWVLW